MAIGPGTDIGRYHIIEQLGEGGMAVVYKAYDTRLDNEVAIKFIRTERLVPEYRERTLKRFQIEAKKMAQLQHRNIVRVTDYGEYEEIPYLVMEYLPGGTLKDKMGNPLPWMEAARLLKPIADALSYAHGKGLIHRDIKPSNILITESGDPVLTDFGIAKVLTGEETMDLTVTGIGVGTPEYMAPEQAEGRTVDERADVYSLGVVFYELVTGRKPFIADTPMAVVIKQMRDPLPQPSQFVRGLPAQVEHILFKALTKDPKDRYQSMSDLVRSFDSLLSLKAGDIRNSDISRVDPLKKEEPIIILDEKSQRINNKGEKKLPGFFYPVVAVAILLIGLLIYYGAFHSNEAAEEAEQVVEVTQVVEVETVEPEYKLWQKSIRQAVAAAIDREAILEAVFDGRNIPAYHMVPESYPYATEPFLEKYGTRDLERSRELLTEAGYSEGKPFEFDLRYNTNPDYRTINDDIMETIVEQLEETSMIEVNLQPINGSEYYDALETGAISFFQSGWLPDFVDPDTWLTPFASCEQSPDMYINYCNNEMDALLQEAASTNDTSERESLYRQIGEFYAEEVPVIPLYWDSEFIVLRKGVTGVEIGPVNDFNFNNIEISEDYKPASGDKNIIIIGTTADIESLDAADAYTNDDAEIIKNTGMPLMDYVPGTIELIPAAAEDFPVVSDDGLMYTFTLRSGLRFADGTSLTAADYVYAWQRLNTLGGKISGLVQVYVEDVEAPDKNTVIYKLHKPVGFFTALTATSSFVPVNPEIFPIDEIIKLPATLDGIGPYRMVSHVPGDQLVLESNPYYSGDYPARIEKIIIKTFASSTSVVEAIRAGEIDIVWGGLGLGTVEQLKQDENLTVLELDVPNLTYLAFNHTYERDEN